MLKVSLKMKYFESVASQHLFYNAIVTYNLYGNNNHIYFAISSCFK